jgi:hypothetical protein
MNKLFITILFSFIANYSLGQEQGKVTLSKEETLEYLEKKFIFPGEFPGFNKTAFDGKTYFVFFYPAYGWGNSFGIKINGEGVDLKIAYGTKKIGTDIDKNEVAMVFLSEKKGHPGEDPKGTIRQNRYNPYPYENLNVFYSNYQFNPYHIVEIKDVNTGSLPSELGELKIIFASNSVSFNHTKRAHTSTEKEDYYLLYFSDIEKRGLTNELNLYYFKKDQSTFSTIKKALEHLKDLCIKEDPFRE